MDKKRNRYETRFSVIFEVLPRQENCGDYLDNAKVLRQIDSPDSARGKLGLAFMRWRHRRTRRTPLGGT
jgi:hypothetical protein